MSGAEVLEAGWPVERAHEAMIALGIAAGYLVLPPERPPVAPRGLAGPEVDRWLMRAAESLELDAEPISIIYDETRIALARMGPALVPLDDEERHWLAITSARAGRVRVLAPGGEVVELPLEAVRAQVARDCDEEGDRLIAPVIEAAGLGDRLDPRARQELRHQLRSQRRIRRAFMIRPHPGAGWRVLARDARLLRPLLLLLASQLLGSLALILAWAAVGSGVLEGRVEAAWLVAAALLALSQVPLRAAGSWAQGTFALEAARVLKQRLFHGVLRIDRDEIRRDGAGQLVARVMEAEAIETLALGGGLATGLATLELLMAVGILLLLDASWVLLVLVLGMLANGLMLLRMASRQRAFTDARLGLTHDLIERMVGHRTRITQERPSQWHEEEDLALVRARELAAAADGTEVAYRTMNRLIFVASVAVLMPLWVSGADATRLAACVGGLLLAHRALGSLSGGVEQLVAASISASRIGPLLRAATRRTVVGEPALSIASPARGDVPVVELRGASLQYPGRPSPALCDATLRVGARDRLLCQGPSGGGKSTLAQLLCAMRTPSAGLVLSDGLDLGALGEDEWRSRIILVPQFHENYVFVKSLAFNLLMGSQWPPDEEDLERAEALCRELGLGPLLDRMPAGLMQPVGDSGWQLSHGEQSRVFLARALLCKDARMLVLDESFGALDPSTLERCVAVTLHRAPALMVIAHP
ncbi:MAG: ABC transporter ATP-binding protein [Myxococcales bacterium]|nr:ABC transporter ATP-binding protein [Myxococcales bacterium]